MSAFSATLTRSSNLSFAIATRDGSTITTVGDAADFFSGLGEERRQQSHWRVAIRMLDTALREPRYLKAATMSLQTALAMDGLVERMQS
jgi:hypothetical protein